MRLTKQDREYEKIVKKNLATVCVGDDVKVVNCLEASSNKCLGKTLKVLSEPYQICGTWCVKLECFGWFDIGRLDKCTN